LFRRLKEIAVKALETAGNPFRCHDRFDAIDRGSMAVGRQMCALLAMQAFDFNIPIVNDVRQMGGRPLRHSPTERTVVKHHNRFALT
jgi:hypothetical protein